MALRLRVILVPTVLIAAPVLAQDDARPAATPSVASYLCTFAGKCDGDADTTAITRDAPATKGFRLARPVDEKKPLTPASVSRSDAVVTPHSGRGPRAGAPTPGRSYRGPARAYPATAPMPEVGGSPRANLFIGFKLNSAELSPQGVEAARVFAQALMTPELRDKRFLIEGHTDVRGGQAVNAPLSARRAEAVTNFLVSAGVDRSRLEARGFGSARPLAGHSAAEPINRRVEAALLR